MRADELMVKRSNNTVEFKVDTEIFGEELQAFGVESNLFTAEIKQNGVTKVQHVETGRDATAEFDLEEMAADIEFSKKHHAATFYGK